MRCGSKIVERWGWPEISIKDRKFFMFLNSKNTKSTLVLIVLAFALFMYALLALPFKAKARSNARLSEISELPFENFNGVLSGATMIQNLSSDFSLCTVTAVISFIFDFNSEIFTTASTLKEEVVRFNAFSETFLESSQRHCAVLLTVKGGAEKLYVEGMNQRIGVFEFSVTGEFFNFHFFISRWWFRIYYMKKFASTHLIFVDSDILALYRDTSYFFESGEHSWDFALTVTRCPLNECLINAGIILVHRSGFGSMQLFSRYVIEDLLEAGHTNDQLSMLDVLNKYGRPLVQRPSKYVPYVDGSVIKSQCVHVNLPKSKHTSKILITRSEEWNADPKRLLPYTKFSHYKGARKKYMSEHFRRISSFGKNFLSHKGGNWCSKNSPPQKCPIRQITFIHEC